jgi:hypothetical protein
MYVISFTDAVTVIKLQFRHNLAYIAYLIIHVIISNEFYRCSSCHQIAAPSQSWRYAYLIVKSILFLVSTTVPSRHNPFPGCASASSDSESLYNIHWPPRWWPHSRRRFCSTLCIYLIVYHLSQYMADDPPSSTGKRTQEDALHLGPRKKA